jgi:hypothetical protein
MRGMIVTCPLLHRYAAAQLEALIASSVGSVPDAYARELQARLGECDAAGGRDADISGDEDTATFPDIVGAAGTAAEVAEFVDMLLLL